MTVVTSFFCFFGLVVVRCCPVDFFPVPASFSQLHAPDLVFTHHSAAIKDGSFRHLLPDGWKPYSGILWLLFLLNKFSLVLFFLSCSLVLPLFLFCFPYQLLQLLPKTLDKRTSGRFALCRILNKKKKKCC